MQLAGFVLGNDFKERLDAVKRDENALFSAYRDAGGKGGSKRLHMHCPFCGDDSGFMIGVDQNGRAAWVCYAGKANCGPAPGKKFTGSIVDMVARARGIDSKRACVEAVDRYGSGARKDAQTQSAQTGQANGQKPQAFQQPREQRKEGKLYLSVDLAIEACVWGLKQDRKIRNASFTKYWQYRNEKSEPVIVEIRFDMEKMKGGNDPQTATQWVKKKEFRFAHRDGNGWRLNKGAWGRPEKLCPLYNLPELLKAIREGVEEVNVVEGAKCADELMKLGMLATTSQGGNGRPAETDWSILRQFKRVTIWPDADDPHPVKGTIAGDEFVKTVVGLINHVR